MADADRLGGHEAASGARARTLGIGIGFALALTIMTLQAATNARAAQEATETEAQTLRDRAYKLYKDDSAEKKEFEEFLDSIADEIANGEDDALRAAFWLHRGLGRRGSREERHEHLERAHALREHVPVKSRWWVDETYAQSLQIKQQWPEAGRVLEQVAEEMPPTYSRYPSIQISLAHNARVQRDFDAAHRHLDIANERIEQATRPLDARSDLLRIRCLTYLDQGLPMEARAIWDTYWGVLEEIEAKRAAEENGPPVVDMARAKCRLIEIYNAVAAYESAARAGKEALVWLGEREPSHASAIRLRLAIALMRLEAGDPDRPAEAEALLRRVADDAKAFRSDRIEARLQLARIATIERRLADARVELDRFDESYDLATLVLTERALAIAFELEWQLASAEVARIDGKLPDASLSALESAYRTAARSYDEVLASWFSQEVRSTGSGFMRASQARWLLGSIVSAALRLDSSERGHERALAHIVDASRAGSLAREFGASTIDVDPSALLADGEGLLVYLRTAGSSYVFAVDHDGITHAPLAPLDDVEPRIARMLGELLRSPYSLPDADRSKRAEVLDTERRELFRLLVPPMLRERFDSWSGVALTGTEILGYLPFEALIDENGRAISLTKEVRYLPSLPVAAALVDRRTLRRTTTSDPSLAGVLVASPRPGTDIDDLAPGLEPLRFTPEEAKELVAASDTMPWEFLLDERATLGELDTDLLSRSAVIQWFAHGIHDPTRAASARIVVSPDTEGDSLIDPRELQALALPPLVVMMVCGAGRGAQRWGDPGTTDFSGPAFRSPRVESVVLPYARLEYESARRLSRELYAQMAEGQPLGAAMLAARRALARRDDGRYADPFYHSLLHVHGLADAVPFPESMIPEKAERQGISIVVAVIALGAVLAVGVWIVRARSS